jgi:glucosylglycerate phosphorylase
MENLLDRYRGRIPVPADPSLSERDSFLITYPDQVRASGQPPLLSLAAFCAARLRGMVTTIHILPFFPSSSDDGFAVKDFRLVDPGLGDWSAVEKLGKSFRLMFDGVINHASAQGSWFQAFRRGESPYRDYFLTVTGDPDLSTVVRPRALPLLTEFQTSTGPRRVWTTFSADQVDLDYHNPAVLLDIFDILLAYACHGAQFIRLDAIAYLWKEIGSTCIHLPQAHAIVQLLRSVLDELAPHVRLITETNVAHAENVAWFGDGHNEAQLVYNFALPPLILHTFLTGDVSALRNWATGLTLPSDQTTFLNFLASHDGIGLNPVRNILTSPEIQALVDRTILQGGLISNKQEPDGRNSPYELNINYFDALSDPSGQEPLSTQINRFMAAHACMASLQGVPAFYFHSLFGSRNGKDEVRSSGSNRAINRQKMELASLEGQLSEPASLPYQVYERFRTLLSLRASTTAFHPNGPQEILDAGPAIFAILRSSPDGARQALCLQNVTSRQQKVGILGSSYVLEPYQVLWTIDP